MLYDSKRSYPWLSRTAIWVAEQITSAKFAIQEDESGLIKIICDGIGYISQPQPSNKDIELGKGVESHK